MENIEYQMKEIPGYEGLYAISSQGDVFSVKRGKMLKQSLNTPGYFFVCLYKDGMRKHLLTHRLVATTFLPNDKNNKFVDHVDGNTTNNNVINLRWCNYSQNTCNSKKTTRTCSSLYKGVSLVKSSGKWRVSVSENGKRKNRGHFENEKDAAIAYNKIAVEIYGGFARLNDVT